MSSIVALRAAVAFVLLGLALLVLALPAIGNPPRKGACDAHRHEAAVLNEQVVVYATETPYPLLPGARQTVYHACWRPKGLSVELGADGPAMYPYAPDATTNNIRAAGTYVAAQSSSGEGTAQECSKYSDSRTCPSPLFWVRVIDTRTRRHADLPRGEASPARAAPAITVSPQGAVAWLSNNNAGGYSLVATALHPRGPSTFAASPSALDTGNVDPRSLRFVGRTLHWVDDGQPHQQKLA